MNLKLIVILILLTSSLCKAEDDAKWATDLSSNATGMVWQHLKKQFEEQEKLELGSNFVKRPVGLYIFVSTSMSKPLLKSYAEEANKYDGVLVFKGLPNGSFKELAKLVRELVGNQGNQMAFQIDDEAFEKFEVREVPTMILTKEAEYVPNQTPVVMFDKIIGNVGIRYALEQFSTSGELAKEASKYLRGIEK